MRVPVLDWNFEASIEPLLKKENLAYIAGDLFEIARGLNTHKLPSVVSFIDDLERHRLPLLLVRQMKVQESKIRNGAYFLQ